MATTLGNYSFGAAAYSNTGLAMPECCNLSQVTINNKSNFQIEGYILPEKLPGMPYQDFHNVVIKSNLKNSSTVSTSTSTNNYSDIVIQEPFINQGKSLYGEWDEFKDDDAGRSSTKSTILKIALVLANVPLQVYIFFMYPQFRFVGIYIVMLAHAYNGYTLNLIVFDILGLCVIALAHVMYRRALELVE